VTDADELSERRIEHHLEQIYFVGLAVITGIPCFDLLLD
jgi:hypothetical protein